MNISKNSVLIGLTLCSALLVTGCNNSETATKTDAAVETTDTAEVSTTDTVEETTAEATTSTDSISSHGLAQMLASTTTTAFFMPFTMGDDLSAEQTACLKSRDPNLGIAETQGFLKQHLTDEEIQSIDAFYETDTGKRVNQFSQEQLAIASGDTVDNPIAAPTADEMAEMQEYAQQPAFQKLAAIDETTGGNQLVEALTPALNSELERCGIDAAI